MTYFATTVQDWRRNSNRWLLVGVLLGAVAGATAYHAIEPAQADSPRRVAAIIFDVGSHLCKDWSGLANVERTGKDYYTFTCRRYAEFKNLEVR